MEPIKPVKLCTACKHCAAHPELLVSGQGRLYQYNCFHPNNIRGYAAVDGSPIFKTPYCVELRITVGSPTPLHEVCTAAGNWWEPKPVETAAVKQIIKAGAKSDTDLLVSLGI